MLVQVIEDRHAFDQNLAVLQNHRGHATKGIVDGEFVGVGKGRPRPMLIAEPMEVQGDVTP